MTNHPKISVIQSSYNDELFIEKAVRSILAQSFTDFEYIIINDGSTDRTGDILASLAKEDDRITIITQKNRGLVAALNTALSYSKGQFIARMDGDDISLPSRFEQQLSVLESDSQLIVCGGSFEIIDSSGLLIGTTLLPKSDAALKRHMHVGNPFAHGSIMARRDLIVSKGGYLDVGPIEDYDLWIRLIDSGAFAAIESPIFQFRKNQAGISSTNHSRQMQLRASYLDKLWATPPATRNRNQMRAEIEQASNQAIARVIADDLATISIKRIRYGKRLIGLRQLVTLFFSGKQGCIAVSNKLMKLTPLSIVSTQRKVVV